MSHSSPSLRNRQKPQDKCAPHTTAQSSLNRLFFLKKYTCEHTFTIWVTHQMEVLGTEVLVICNAIVMTNCKKQIKCNKKKI